MTVDSRLQAYQSVKLGIVIAGVHESRKVTLESEQANEITAELPLPAMNRLEVWVAQWVSHLASPPLLILAAAFLVASREQAATAWLWAAGHGLLSAALPVAYIVRLVRQGRASDVHLPARTERLRPLLLASAGGLAAYLLLRAGGAPEPQIWLAAAGSAQTAVVFLITLRWKISMHAAAATGLSVLAVAVLGAAGLWLAILIPVVAWSRLRLRRHTPAQVVGGALCGALVFGGLFAFPYLTMHLPG